MNKHSGNPGHQGSYVATQSWRTAGQLSPAWTSRLCSQTPGVWMESSSLSLSLTKPSVCFLCLPVDGPPMEPSQFVSVVPKYPDKMGFDEVGKVSVCACARMCMYVACLHVCIGGQARSYIWEPAKLAWWLKRHQGLGKTSQFVTCLSLLILKKEHLGVPGQVSQCSMQLLDSRSHEFKPHAGCGAYLK